MIMLKKSYRILAFSITALILLAIIAAIVFNFAASYPRGAVVTNGHGCATIAGHILDKGGSAMDAAIAALFCEGVAMPQSTGLGGGFLMTVYIRETGVVASLNSREVAPGLANETMYGNNSALATKGGLAVAVPGELRGMWYAYQKFGGKVPWRDLVQPTIDLCNNGILITPYVANVLVQKVDLLYSDPMLREVFIDPATNLTYLQGQYVKRLRLAKALKIIAEEGGDALHNGTLTEQFALDIQNAGGIITAEDLNNYQPEWQDPIKISMPFNQELYTAPLPGSGVVLGFIMNLLNGFLDYSQPHSVVNWQRIIESFKYGYGRRTELGDLNFVDIGELVDNLTSSDYADEIRRHISDNWTSQNASHYGANTVQVEDHGTAHISVLAPNGDAVSVTSTINLYFGAGFMSESTGIILNDEMDDFSSPLFSNDFNIPPSVSNYIRPGKRPLSSMCPSIVVGEDGDVRLVIGGAGGTKITTSIALVMIKDLWFNMTIDDAVNDRRMHHQLFPMVLELENSYTDDPVFVQALTQIGHEVQLSPANGFSAVTAIARKGSHSIKPTSDKRRPGEDVLVD